MASADADETRYVAGTATDEVIERTETWFVARGTPRLSESANPSEFTLARALPALSLVFAVQTFLGIRRGWPGLSLPASVLVTAVVLLLARLLVNAGTEGTGLQRVQSAGIVEESAFVLLPAVVWAVATGRIYAGLVTAALNLGALVALYVVFSFPVVRSWYRGAGRAIRRTETVIEMALRAFPLLLVASLFFFLNSELWQVASEIATPLYWSATGSLFLIVLAVSIWRAHRSLSHPDLFDSTDEIVALCRATPVEPVAPALAEAALDAPLLNHRQRVEVGTVLAYSIFTQIVLVSIPVTVFFTLFGVLVIPPSVIERWTGEALTSALVSTTLFETEVGVTRELLRVSGLVGSFSALYFAVNTAVDRTYREQFAEQLPTEIKRTLAVRAVYTTLLERRERRSTEP